MKTKLMWLVVVCVVLLCQTGCMLKMNRKTHTRAEVSIPNPICDVIDSFSGRRQVTQPVVFRRQTSRTRNNMGPYYGCK